MRRFFTILLALSFFHTATGVTESPETGTAPGSLLFPDAHAALSAWCDNAVPIQCGDFLPYETNAGAGNDIGAYPVCSAALYPAPDKVYRLLKTTPGDLQIGLEILTPGLDLDIFLLSDNCNQLTCLRAGVTTNTQSNRETIVLANAPAGVYYIVVDGKTANAQGNYRLETGCGSLPCNSAVPVQCGVPFNHTNAGGSDNVALYGCDNDAYNAGNNGPEVVHTFTLTQAGWVNIRLSNLLDNLDLFLLRTCDRTGCVTSSKNAGSTNEQITVFLQPGTYYIVVDGYNGAVSTYTLLVECASGCNLSLAGVTPAAATCGQSNGAVSLVASGGASPYTVQYSGPSNGTFVSPSAASSISNLPAGLYQVRLIDGNGCSVQQSVTVPSNSNMNVGLQMQPDVCGAGGSARFTVSNGTPPFTVQLSGPVSGNYNAGNTNPYTISGLAQGNYTAYVRDALGCVVVRTFAIAYSSGIFSFTAAPVPATCNSPGRIAVQTSGGTAPYTATVSGPVNLTQTSNANQFNILNLPAGTYTVVVRSSGSGCVFIRTVTVPYSGLLVAASAHSGACNQPGSISLQLAGGVPPYSISWGGPVPGNANTVASSYLISGLAAGSYPVQVQDAGGCSFYQVLTINASAATLSATFTPFGGSCSATGSIAVQVNNGTPPYVISWTGQSTGSATTSSPAFTIPNLPGGNYMIQVTAAGNCTRMGMATLQTGAPLQVSVSSNTAGCTQNGSVGLTMTGTGPFHIAWSGPASGSANTSNANYTIPNLSAGTYTIVVTSAGGCQVTRTASVAGGGLNFNLMAIDPSCQLCAAIWIDIYNGQGPYTVTWTGPTTGSIVTSQTNFDVYCVNPGTYTVTITDANGCTGTQTITIHNSDTNLQVTITPNATDCAGGPNGSMLIHIANGQAPYVIHWVGPVSGNWTTSLQLFSLYNLLPGTYTVTITDAQNCVTSIPVTIEASLGLVATPIPGLCGQPGGLALSYAGGLPPYTIQWSGAATGSTTTSGTTFNIPNLPAGAYSVTVSSSNSCSQTVQATVTTTPDVVCTAVPVPGLCGAYGSIHIGISSGTPAFHITWNGPVSGSASSSDFFYQIGNLPSGTYTITVKDVNNCICTHTVTLQNGVALQDVTVHPVPGICGQNGSIGLNIIGGTAPFLVSWTGPASGSATTSNTTYNIPDLPSGTYTITVVDANNCSRSRTVVLNNQPNNLHITTAAVPGVCDLPGQIHVTISGGPAPYTVSWTGPANGSTTTSNTSIFIPNLPSGTYTVTVTDAQGCVRTKTVALHNLPNNLYITATPVPGICGLPGQIHVTMSGGPAPYTVAWSGPASNSAMTVNTSLNIPNLPSGTYTVTVTDAQGCVRSKTVVLNNQPNNLHITATPIPGVCGYPGQIHVTMSGSPGPYTVAWTGPASGSTSTGNASFHITNLPSGTYTVTVTDHQGCTRTQTVTLYNQPNNLHITATPVPGICDQPGQIHVTMSGGPAPYTVAWTGPASGSTTTGNASFHITNLPSGAYTVTVTDAQGCSRTQTVTLYNQPNNLHITATPAPGICDQPGQIHVTISGGPAPYTVAWSGPASGSTTTANASFNIINLPSGVYVVTVTDAQGCVRSKTVTLNNQPNNLHITATPAPGICGLPGQIHVTMSGGPAPYTVAWSGPSSGSNTTSNASFQITNLPSGVYVVTVTDAQGCTRTQTVHLQNQPNNLHITATPSPGVCDQPGQIHVTMSGGPAPYTVAWTGPASGSTTTGNASFHITNLPSGTYTVTVTDAQGCSRTQTVTLNNQPNNLHITATPVPGVCDQPGQIHVTMSGAPGPYTVAWSGPASGSTTTANASFIIPNLPSGAYTVTVTDAQGCQRSQTATLNNGAAITLSATGVNGICGQNGSIQLTIGGTAPPYSVSWTGPASGNANAPGSSFTITDLPGGAYTITVSSGPNCSATRTVTLNNGAVFGFSVTPNPGICDQNGSLLLNFSGATFPIAVSWSGPVSGSATANSGSYTIPNLPSGAYTITATTAQNCTDTRTAALDNSTNTLIVTGTPVNGVCGEPGYVTLAFAGGTAPYAITWTGAASGSANTSNATYTVANLGPGTYTFTVTSANGCVQSTTASVEVSDTDIAVTATAVRGICGQQGSVEVVISGGNPSFTIQWSGPQSGSVTTSNSTFVINNLSAGTYQVSVTDATGCSETGTAVLIAPVVNVQIGVAAVNGLCAQPGAVTVSILSGTAPYAISWVGPVNGSTSTSSSSFTISPAPAGVYFVTVTDANGCTDTRTISVTTQPGVNLTTLATNGVCGQPGSIIVNLVGGTGPFTIAWSGAATGSTTVSGTTYTIPNLGSGNYQISVTDANSCTASAAELLNNGGVTFSINAFPTHGICGDLGKIRVYLYGGVGPFLVTWTGPVSGSATTTSSTYEILNLPSGLYMISVTDAQGCVGMDVEMLFNSDTAVFQAQVSAINGTCGNLGSIWITILNGQGPFVISWTGPVSGSLTTSSTSFDIVDLPGGTYTVTIRDGNDCVRTYTIVVVNAPDNLNVSLTPNNNTCGNPGSLTVNIAGNAPPYVITWTSIYGNGSQTINGTTFTIPNLQTGNYTVRVDDSAGCFEVNSQQVNNETGVFLMTVVPNVGGCNYQGALQVNVSGGVPPYQLTWSGPMNGSVTFHTNSYNIFGLNPGAYNIMVTDAAGCVRWQLITLTPGVSAPVAAFSASTNLLTATFTNNSSPGNYVWSFGDGSGSTAVNPVHTYAQSGTYTVCISVSNPCGSTTNCNNVTITIPSNVVILDVGENSGSPGANIVVPVRISNCSLLASLAGSLAVQHSSVASVVNVQPAAIAPQFNAVNKTFSFTAGSQGVALQQNQILFYLIVQLTGAPGQSSEIYIVNSPIAVSVSGLVNGVPTVLPHVTFKGNVSITPFIQTDEEFATYWDAPTPEEEIRRNADAVEWVETVAADMGQPSALLPPAGEGPTNTTPAEGYMLHQNAPNPFTGNTAIAFDLPEAMDAVLIVTDPLGRIVRIERGNYPAGRNTVWFEAGSFGPGVYRYTLRTAGYSATRSMIIAR